MKRLRIPIRLAAAAALAAALCLPAAAQQARPVRALLQLPNERLDVLLVGRENDRILYRRHDAPAGVAAGMPLSAIQAGEFDLEIDEAVVTRAVNERQWELAAQMLLGRVRDAMPYLDIPENNAVGPAVQAASYLLIEARATARRPGERARARANELFLSAFHTLRAISRAQWHPQGEPSGLRALLCLIEIGRLEDASRVFAAARRPNRGDSAFGVHALVEARLLYEQDDARSALNALIPSILYENKDIHVFPEALMLAARCYEDLLEIHRTRDVYYEVARLFQGTEWAAEARRRLEIIHRSRLTEEIEDVDVVSVFFERFEDMDQRVEEFLRQSEPAPAE